MRKKNCFEVLRRESIVSECLQQCPQQSPNNACMVKLCSLVIHDSDAATGMALFGPRK
jgi:hypothetical protein